MKIDFKVVTWERFFITNPDDEKLILEKIKEGKIQTADDLFDYAGSVEKEHIDGITTEPFVNETEETIAVWDGTTQIFSNKGKK